ncbi:hypothetical protein HOE37_00260 [Candidatus Woesearchaeota archaeon]|nr:hypothetical protein [Candidatus Woesearchaeota archaeon]MBT4336207.1 hypothetical protein [Candidatus Woesearchaeota archaeon]MBT4468814.1 hypothetical protein [Candidatus Woesearchaeota archaeon]MBT6744867.1 hypothetical protein [Candidatus Woesearchaeota archaeon]
MDLELLKEIGLTDGEIRVYLALFKLGSTSTGPLIKESKVHASKVYPILDRLIEKGLVSFVKLDKKTIYTANPATTIISYLDKLQGKIGQQKKSAVNLIEELTKLKSLNKTESETTVFKGAKGLKNAYNIAIKELKKGEDCYAMFLPKVANNLLPFFEKLITDVSKKKVNHYLLYNELSPEIDLIKHLPGTNVRVDSPHGYQSPAEMCVYGEYTIVSTSGGKEYLTILIKDKIIANSFKNQFKAIWNQEVQTFHGVEGMQFAFDEALRATPNGATSYVFGATKTSKGTDKLLFEYNKRRAEKGIKLKILFNEEATSSKTTRSARKETNPLAEIKIMPHESTPSAYEVFPDRVIITTASRGNPTSIVIKDKEFVKTCIIQFNELWNQKTRTFRGKKGVETIFNEALNSKEIRFIGGNWGMVKYHKAFFENWNLEREKKKIMWLDLVDADVLIKQKEVPKQLKHYQVKVLPEQVNSPGVIFIYGNKVATIIWKKEAIINVVESKETVDHYKKYFDYLWDQRIKTYSGKDGVKNLLNTMLDTESKEYFAYGGPQKAYDLLGHTFWKSFHEKRVHKGIDAELVFHSSLGWWGDKLNELELTEVRTTKKDFEELTETVICGNKVAIIVWLDHPFGILMEEPLAAKSYQKFFELIWEK